MSGRRPALNRELSERETEMLRVVGEYRVLSGGQLRRWFFPVLESGSEAGALRRSQRTLKRLVDDGLLETLDRRVGGVRAGSAGHCYVLGYRGQRLVHPERRARSHVVPGERFVAHALAVGELAVGLIEAERRGHLEILECVTEPDCWRHYVGPGGGTEILKPDMFVAVGDGATEHRCFIEVDRATESLKRVERKCRQYLAYLRSGREQEQHGVFPKVLWTVPHDKRHQHLLGVFARLPPPSPRLFSAVLHDNANQHLKGGAP